MRGRRRRVEINATGVPSEREEQVRLVRWALEMARTHPVFGLLYAVPNGGYRTKTTAVKMKAEGQRAGVPDLVLPHPARGYHGLYLELKARKNGRLSNHQREWLRRLKEQGYRAVVAKGYDVARDELMWYAGLSEKVSDATEVEL